MLRVETTVVMCERHKRRYHGDVTRRQVRRLFIRDLCTRISFPIKASCEAAWPSGETIRAQLLRIFWMSLRENHAFLALSLISGAHASACTFIISIAANIARNFPEKVSMNLRHWCVGRRVKTRAENTSRDSWYRFSELVWWKTIGKRGQGNTANKVLIEQRLVAADKMKIYLKNNLIR